jgi:L-seryl-tRNA(Ser) seleniumtransferase
VAATRRTLFQLLTAWPFSKLAAATRPASLYQELGVRPVINCKGAYTMIGASKKWPELDAAMAEASRQFVYIEELQEKVGERLAKLVGSEAAMVTTGAAGAITLGTCACLTATDEDKVRRLPDLTGMRSEVLIEKSHRNPFDHAVRDTGVKLVEFESKDQLRNAISPRTAMLYFLGGGGHGEEEDLVSFEDCLAICKPAGVPVMMDAANLIPPWENVRKLAVLGTDLICISGGKHMRGPQCSGILAGRRDLVSAALMNSSPNEDAFGRPLKVGREEIIGVWLACEKYAKLDFAALDRQLLEQAEYLARELRKIPGLEVSFAPYEKHRRIHRVVAQWDERAVGLTADEVERRLLEGEPRIAVLRNQPQGLKFALFLADPGDERLVARRMREIFRRA